MLYLISLLTVLGVSLAFNISPLNGFKKLMARFDQAAIFLLIAGTYTPSSRWSAERRRRRC